MNWFYIAVGLMAIGALLFFLWFKSLHGPDFQRGLAYGEALLAGEFDSDVAQALGKKVDDVEPNDRSDYLLRKSMEASDFGDRNDFDRGMVAALPSYSGG